MTELTLSSLDTAVLTAGSVSMMIDVDQALVVLGGDIGPALHQPIQMLARDVDAGATAGLPIAVLSGGVTSLDLHGVWLLLELRRAAGPAGLRLDAPSDAVREVLYVHGLSGLLGLCTDHSDRNTAVTRPNTVA